MQEVGSQPAAITEVTAHASLHISSISTICLASIILAWLLTLDLSSIWRRASAIGLVADMVRWERILDPLEVAQPIDGHIHPPIFYRIRLGMPSEGQEQHL